MTDSLFVGFRKVEFGLNLLVLIFLVSLNTFCATVIIFHFISFSLNDFYGVIDFLRRYSLDWFVHSVKLRWAEI